jgi:hypothetical protein
MTGMPDEPASDPRAPIEIDPDRIGGITGDPQEVVEQPDLSFERLNEAKWIGDVFGMRLAAMMLVRRKRRLAGLPNGPIPWMPIAVTTAFAMVLVAVCWLAIRAIG